MYEVKQAKISQGYEVFAPLYFVACCVSTTKAFFIPHVLFVTCFQYGHREVLIYLTEPGPCFMTRKAAVPLFRHTLAAHFWQEIDGISAANSWMR